MDALILVDIQNDFLPGGALAVAGGDLVVPVANKLIGESQLIAATKDWHPIDHVSFAATHPGRQAFQIIGIDGVNQTLWPTHCVQYTGGACFAPGLETGRITRIFPKGTNPDFDAYSGFFDNARRQATGLADWLRSRGVSSVTVCGLATDYCVRATAIDAATEGFTVRVVEAGCRGVNMAPGDTDAALRAMQDAGVQIV